MGRSSLDVKAEVVARQRGNLSAPQTSSTPSTKPYQNKKNNRKKNHAHLTITQSKPSSFCNLLADLQSCLSSILAPPTQAIQNLIGLILNLLLLVFISLLRPIFYILQELYINKCHIAADIFDDFDSVANKDSSTSTHIATYLCSFDTDHKDGLSYLLSPAVLGRS